MKDLFIKQLEKYSESLEFHFKDMVNIDFVIENENLYILSACLGNRTPLANLRIVMSMFCEGIIDVNDVINKIKFQELQEILDTQTIVNKDELKIIANGVSGSSGICSARTCFTSNQAQEFIKNNEYYIYCCYDLVPNDIEILHSNYCLGVVSARGGITSHAAIVCRSLGLPCICHVDENRMSNFINQEITIDGNEGKIYSGIAIVEKSNINLEEIEMLRVLLNLIIKYNVVLSDSSPLVWRLWDIIVLKRRYVQNKNIKRIVNKLKHTYISFKPPSQRKLQQIQSKLENIDNGSILLEGFIEYLQSRLAAQVSLGHHYLYMRPLLDPMQAIFFDTSRELSGDMDLSGIQLTGLEFFNLNRFVDSFIDIYSIKIYFSTSVICSNIEGVYRMSSELNYLDYTNPNGEGLIINSFNVEKMAIYINDVLISPDELPKIYHLIRRRQYFWTWYKDNNISKREIIMYLKSKTYQFERIHSKIYFLCEEMNLIKDGRLTVVGETLIGSEKVTKTKDIDYIIDEVVSRGFNDNSNECNDFLELIKKKDFKDLIALELYELYFWNDRHEFDLELLRAIVNAVSDYFSDPEVIKEIECGILQTLPSTIIISIVGSIWLKMKNHINKKSESREHSSWGRIQENIKKIDNELSNHDYILSDEIERIFGVSREEIQPLLKLCGCKCYLHKNRSIWIKVGTKEARVREILKEHNFKCRRK